MHPDATDPAKRWHLHLYLKLEKRLDVADRRSTRKMDIRGASGQVCHPEIRAVAAGAMNRTETLEYIAKHQGEEDPFLYGDLKAPLPDLVGMYIRKRTEDRAAEDAAAGAQDAAASAKPKKVALP